MSMQAFYTQVFTPAPHSRFASFARVAEAGLHKVLAVRSELAWDSWLEAK